MDPFIYIPEYPIIICKVCKYRYIANAVRRHLEYIYTTISAEEVNTIVRKVDAIPELIYIWNGLDKFPFPLPTIEPILYIKAPKTNGLGCNKCSYIILD
ncbi:hypothetical protein EDB80DRAFT_592766 [Ilyonectria destructans]|nr:hypothetical protein EDB80DRAFT_592766 [Ilyonectria destructans]